MNKSLFAFIIALFLINTSYSQPKWTFSLTGGYSMPVSDLKGSFADTLGSAGSIDFSRQTTYLVKKGFNIGVTGKYSVDTSGSARLTASFLYNGFSQSKDYSRPTGSRTISNKINIVSLVIGAEYNIRPKEKINPFIGLEFAFNTISGKIQGTGDTTFSYSRKSETRFGVNANAGIDIRLKKDIGIVLGVRYSMDNLFGKSRTTATTSTNTDAEQTPGGLVNNELPLNDSESGAIQAKSIIHLQFYTGIIFNFGKTK